MSKGHVPVLNRVLITSKGVHIPLEMAPAMAPATNNCHAIIVLGEEEEQKEYDEDGVAASSAATLVVILVLVDDDDDDDEVLRFN